MPYFNCCSAVCGNINKGLADKLQKIQNRAARILTFSNYEVAQLLAYWWYPWYPHFSFRRFLASFD